MLAQIYILDDMRKGSSLVTKECLGCGASFEVLRCYEQRQRYCTRECAKAHPERLGRKQGARLSKVCEVCGSSFEVRPCDSTQRFCSQKCTALNASQVSAAIPKEHHAEVCVQCKQSFEAFASLHRKFCSLVCRDAYVREHGSPRDKRVQCECATCHKPFLIKAHKAALGYGVYCSKACYSRTPEELAANARRHERLRRAREAGAEGDHTGEELYNIFLIQGGRCVYCKQDITKAWTVDHRTALTNGGSHWIDNIQLLCPSCNSRKKNMSHEAFERLIEKRRAA